MVTSAVVTSAVAGHGMRGVSATPGFVVMQPTTLCNLSCAYCYLPDRARNQRMSPAVAEAVAGEVNRWAVARPGYCVVWHGSEPLTAGRALLDQLMTPFVGVEHHVQTNATLINDAWCDLFRRHRVRVNISVDGPRERNVNRVTMGGTPVFKRIMKGIAALRANDLPFSAVCVVSDPRPGLAAELYDFFLDLGCAELGVSIEEHEGVNERSNVRLDRPVRRFWAELLAAWRAEPRIRVREIEHSLGYAAAVLSGTEDLVLPRSIDPMPMIAVDGRVYPLSPELAGFTDPVYGDFSVGNVLKTPLGQLLDRSVPWMLEYLTGVEACRRTCPYFGFCGGAHAANRYFEHGRFDGTQTNHCRHSKINLLEGVLAHCLATTTGGAESSGTGKSTERRVERRTAGADQSNLARIHQAADGLSELLAEVSRSVDSAHCHSEDRSTFYTWHNRPR